MLREIGSEFWKVEIGEKENNVFPRHAKWFISGRSALEYIVEDLLYKCRVKKAWLPSWCCESMIIPFIHHGIEVEFYSVYLKKGELICDIPSNGELILVMDYFGYSCPVEIKNFPGFVIRDLTHSIHSCKYGDADYAFGSLRKWTGITTGGFAVSKEPWESRIGIMPVHKEYVDLKKTAMENKDNFINGITDDKNYLEIYAKAEDILETTGITMAAEEDVKIARSLDISYIVEKRRKNAKYLMNELSEYIVFNQLLETDCPLFIPICVKNRNRLRRFLIENKVYCPVHWPISKYHKLNRITEDIYKNELSIICDQRYDISHMEHMVKLIKKGMELC